MHVLVRGALNGNGKHPAGIGVFDDKRFVYCTGERVLGTPATIEERQAQLEMVLALCAALVELGVPTQTGHFGARMEVELVNDGPVTLILGTQLLERFELEDANSARL